MQKMQIWSLGWEDALGKEMATLPCILAWKIPWTEEPGKLQSMRSQRVINNLGTKQQLQQINILHLMPDIEEGATDIRCSVQFSSVQFIHSVVSDSLRPHGLQHARAPCPSPTPGVYSNSCPLSWWHHPTTLFSVVPFSSRLQSFPASVLC